jgi:pimeloyl-ACP methyl ester carboxylesterase
MAMMLGFGRPAYRLSDMADDTAGLMDHLGIDTAHLVGVSMGGMIAQTLAIRRPDRVRSLASIMSTTGNRRLRMPKLRAFGTLISKPARNRDAYADQVVRTFRIIGSPGFPTDEEWLHTAAAAAYDRCFYPPGVARQIHAVSCSGDRTRRLRELRVPTVVIHGDRDPLIRPSAGRATAGAIPGSRLKIIEGMGHDMPPQVWAVIVDEIDSNASRAAGRESKAEPVGG